MSYWRFSPLKLCNAKNNTQKILHIWNIFFFIFFDYSVWARIKGKEIAIVTENFLNVLNIL